jgi:hypothetical protein
VTEINNVLLCAFGYTYIAGAFISWWILHKSVPGRTPLAAFWFFTLPYLILTEALAPASEDDGDDSSDSGV